MSAFISYSMVFRFSLLASCTLFSACGQAPLFSQAPPDKYKIKLTESVAGVWAREGRDNGERVRVEALSDQRIHFIFFNSDSKKTTVGIPANITATIYFFDQRQWMLLDRTTVSDSPEFKNNARYSLFRFVLEEPNRLCGMEPSKTPFIEAIEAGQLEGSVKKYTNPAVMSRVEVTATGEQWVKWWEGLSQEKKIFMEPKFCFRKLLD